MKFTRLYHSDYLLPFLIALLCLIAIPSYAAPGLNAESCNEDGQCVVFEVDIKLSYSTAAPIVKQTNDVIVINNIANPYGSMVRRHADSCVKQVHVPKEVFLAIIAVMSSISGNGQQPPALTPAQQTILLFYTTLMQQTLQFQCDAKDLGGAAEVSAPPAASTTQPAPVKVK